MSAEQANGASTRAGATGRKGWTAAERVTFGVSVVIVVAIAAVAIVQYLNRAAAATAMFEITVAADQAEQQEDAYVIPFSIRNVGAAGAREVTVRFEVVPENGGEAVDQLTLTIPVLPVQGFGDGMLIVTDDPAAHVIQGRVETFLVP